jgi:7,8-dihydropterin-6-yl-methyl-4-(beta-D-ribofuranosyl)aminobenzene 5'-phosphate synthase
MNKDADIYVPASADMSIPQRKVIAVSQPVKISETIYSLGEIQEMEQSLVIKTTRGNVVMVGCAHPGVTRVLNLASGYGRIYGIVGGLHSFDEFNQLDNLSFICPCHCTEYKLQLKLLFPEKYIECGTGVVININNKKQGG